MFFSKTEQKKRQKLTHSWAIICHIICKKKANNPPNAIHQTHYFCHIICGKKANNPPKSTKSSALFERIFSLFKRKDPLKKNLFSLYFCPFAKYQY